VQITAIDHDLSFPERPGTLFPTKPPPASRSYYEGMPPLLPRDVARHLLALDDEHIDQAMSGGFSAGAIEAAKQRLGEMKERVKEMEAQGFIVDDFATWTTNIDGVPHTASEFLMRGDTPRNSIRTLQEGLEIAKQALGAAPQPLVEALD
jgi:hypothetical protein